MTKAIKEFRSIANEFTVVRLPEFPQETPQLRVWEYNDNYQVQITIDDYWHTLATYYGADGKKTIDSLVEAWNNDLAKPPDQHWAELVAHCRDKILKYHRRELNELVATLAREERGDWSTP